MTPGDQRLDDLDHLGDVVGGAGLMGRIEAAERLRIGQKLVRCRLGDAADGLVQGQRWKVARRPVVDLVIHVGDVADIGDGAVAVDPAQQPVEHIEDDDRARISDMGEVIDRRAADIHAHMGGIDGDELLLRSGQRIVKSQRRHRVLEPCWLGRRPDVQDETAPASEIAS